MLDYYKLNKMELKIDKRRNLLLSMARNLSVRPGRELSAEEVKALTDALFESDLPTESPSGKPILRVISEDRIEDFFKK
jgi:DNA mismatch repair protein MutL